MEFVPYMLYLRATFWRLHSSKQKVNNRCGNIHNHNKVPAMANFSTCGTLRPNANFNNLFKLPMLVRLMPLIFEQDQNSKD